MFSQYKILGLIPARGGSKGLLRKNILPLAGKPLISWTIEAAKENKYIDKVFVSTEDAEIAQVSKTYGADVSYLRPKELAIDTAKTIDVVLHTLDEFSRRGEKYDIVALLQPTSPLRTNCHIDFAIEKLFDEKIKSVISVSEVDHHPYWCNKLQKNGCMDDFINKNFLNLRRQDLPKYYRLNGAIYVAYSEFLYESKSFFGHNTYSHIMPKEQSIDVDNEVDFLMAELLMNKRK